jgi:hypothetical protein
MQQPHNPFQHSFSTNIGKQTEFTVPPMQATRGTLVADIVDQGKKEAPELSMKKFDDAALQAQAMMRQVHKVFATAYRECMLEMRNILQAKLTNATNVTQGPQAPEPPARHRTRSSSRI